MKFFLFPIVLLIFSAFSSTVHAEYGQVHLGERPPIQYERVNQEHYHKGVLLVKFSPEMARHLKESPPVADEKGIVSFGIEPLDLLNQQYGVRQAELHFSSSAFRNGFTERHKAWGFHLWYRLEADEKTDIVDMLRSYERLEQIEIAEPSFKKELIEGVHFEEYLSDRGNDIDKLNRGDEWIPDDTHYQHQWHYNNTGQFDGTPGADISMPLAWGKEKGDTLVIVAILDTGVEYYHEDLAGNMWHEIGYNFVTDSEVIEPMPHGTHVAGTVAAVNNNNTGVAGVAGGSGNNDGVRIMVCQIFTTYGSGGHHLAPVYAADNGAAISQNSWGYGAPGVYEHNVLDAIDYFNQHGGGDAMEGGLTVFASGNQNSSLNFYPGYYSGAMAVASTNNDDLRSSFSNYGSHIEISAPGGGENKGVLSTIHENQYAYISGTSMAAPHVSGVAALINSLVYGELNAGEVREILKISGDDIYSLNPNYQGMLGEGRLNAYEALNVAELFVTLPGNPAEFLANPVSDSDIHLQWNKNIDNDEVLLAWNTESVFGSPEEGLTYEAGDPLPGGGTILYAGEATEFWHQDLDAVTQYFYRIWSKDDQGVYSYGVGTNAVTFCETETLPVSESFDNELFLNCWSFDPIPGSWTYNLEEGNPSPSMEFYWVPEEILYSYSFVSPLYDGYVDENNIFLEFDIELTNFHGFMTQNMSVEVFDGNQWVEVALFKNTDGSFEWETHLIDITNHVMDSEFQIRFRAHGEGYPTTLSKFLIDNVSLLTCLPPHGLFAFNVGYFNADIAWNPSGTGSEWDLLWGEHNFDVESEGTLVEGLTSTSYTLEGLDDLATYDVYIRSNCGGGSVSTWSGPLTFTTLAVCPAPVNLTVNHVLDQQAAISWSPTGTEEEWEILYGEKGFDPEAEGTSVQGVTDPDFILTGLEMDMEKDVYVRAVCDVEQVSVWTGPVTFQTHCQIAQLPFNEIFEAETQDCWRFPHGKGNWRFGSTNGPPSSQSGPPHALFTMLPGDSQYSYSLTSKVIDGSLGENDEVVRIDYLVFLNSQSNQTVERLSVEYKAFYDQQWILLEEFNNQGVGSGQVEFVRNAQVLTGIQDELFQIRFRAHGASSYSINAWSVDDILVYSSSAEDPCVSPYGLNVYSITSSSAMVNWSSGLNEQEWDLVYGQQGFDPDNEGTLIGEITQKPLEITGLDHSTTYEIYVRSICGDTASDWSLPHSFTTAVATYTVHASSDEHGSIEPEGDIQVDHSSDQTFTFIAQTGYHISDVILDSQSIIDQVNFYNESNAEGEYTLSDVIGDHEIHVEFSINQYEIMVSADPEEAGEVSGYGLYEHGEMVTLSAVPIHDHVFNHWSENGDIVHEAADYTFEVLNQRNLVAHFSSTTSVQDPGALLESLTVYPNPAGDFLYVESPVNLSSLSVIDVTGNKVYLLHDIQQKRVRINTSSLNSGIYFIHILTSEGKTDRKIQVIN